MSGIPFLAPDYVPPVRLDPTGPVLLLPGSRPRAVGLIIPALLAGYAEFVRGDPARGAVILYPSDAIRTQLEAIGLPPGVRAQRAGTGVAASAVLTSSGTMSMHCALAGIPGAIAYRTDALTYLVARWIVRVPFLGIANILLGEPMYPEYIQGAATPAPLPRSWPHAWETRSGARAPPSRPERLRAMLVNPAGPHRG